MNRRNYRSKKRRSRRLDEASRGMQTLDRHVSDVYYRKLADNVLQQVKQNVGRGFKRVTEENAMNTAYHLYFTGYTRSDMQIDVQLVFSGPLKGLETEVLVRTDTPMALSEERFSFGISENPLNTIQRVIKYVTSQFGVY